MNMSEQTSSQNGITHDLVYQFAIGPSAWYAACGSGLYRSADRGAAWELAYASLGAGSPLSTLSAATAAGHDQAPLVFAGLSGGLLRSANDGASWALASQPSPAPIFTALVPSPDFARDGRLFAGTMGDGVLIYSNDGRDWAMWNFGLLDANVLCLAVSPAYAEDQTLLAGVSSGLFRSANGGRSWHEVELPIGYEAVLCLALSPRFAQDGVLYAGTEQAGLLRSADRGRSWRQLGEDMLSEPINSVLLGPRFPEQPELLVLHGARLLHSDDGGDTWEDWRAERLADLEITAVAAPEGFSRDAAVLVGLAGGQIRLI
jgi:photosystem II stability/assembly factor-like uncharacterized protein